MDKLKSAGKKIFNLKSKKIKLTKNVDHRIS